MIKPPTAWSLSLASLRREAITERLNSGIEDDWREDEEAYIGVDEVNREEAVGVGRRRLFDWSAKSRKATGSSILVNITRPYVDSASARVGDMLFPQDDQNWALVPSPSPDPASSLGASDLDRGHETPEADIARRERDVVSRMTAAAERRIHDWLQEGQYSDECRLVIDDASRIGTGVLKGPFPWVTTTRRVDRADGVVAVMETHEIQPRSRRVHAYNIFPDPACGDDIHAGDYIFERDDLSRSELMDLKDQPGYLSEEICEALKEGPVASDINWHDWSGIEKHQNEFEVWYYHGKATIADLLESGVIDEFGEDKDELVLQKRVSVYVVMVNHRVIKAALSAHQGRFPYDVFCWQQRRGYWAGVGVSRHIRPAQRMVTAATRALMDNMGISSGPLLVIDHGLEPQDGDWNITPRKVFYRTAGSDAKTHGIEAVLVPSMQGELQNIIMLGLRMAEEATGLPQLLQGQMGRAPETVGGMAMLTNNATAVLRRLARSFDRLTKSHIGAYFSWLLEYGENPEEKAPVDVVARGSTALVEREGQQAALMQLVQASLQPAFGLDPRKAMREALLTQRLDPARFKAEEMPEEAPDPKVQIAQLNAQVAQERLQGELARQEMQSQTQVVLANIKREIEAMKLASDQEVELAKILALLEKETLNVSSRHELYNAEARLKREEGEGI